MKNSRNTTPSETTRRANDAAGSSASIQGPESGSTSAPRHPSQEDIARRAYQHWESNGRQDGRDQEHWYSAERELNGGTGDELRETRREEP